MPNMRFVPLRGFTLIEVLVVTALFAMVTLLIFSGATQFYQSNSYNVAQSNEVAEARRGVTRFVRDAREMAYAENGAFPVVTMEPHTFSFYSDIDRDASAEFVSYVLADGTLEKQVFDATGTPPVYDLSEPDRREQLAEFVQNMPNGDNTFAYYSETSDEISDAGNLTALRYVTIELTINIDPFRTPQAYTLYGSAAPRNLQNSL